MSQQRLKRVERNKLHNLSAEQLSEVRQRTQANDEEARRRRRQRHQKRREWGKNEYVDDCFVSKLLIKWNFSQLVQYSRLLLLLINRRLIKGDDDEDSHLPQPVNALVYLRYPSEYADTLFGDYTIIRCGDENHHMSFRAYYTLVYKEALALSRQHAQFREDDYEVKRRHSRQLLRACFLIALLYDARVRRFVFSKHDIHYQYLKTHPPPLDKTRRFLSEIQPLVNATLGCALPLEEMCECSVKLWLTKYMFKLE
jgi:hypothetical protein